MTLLLVFRQQALGENAIVGKLTTTGKAQRATKGSTTTTTTTTQGGAAAKPS